jgi:hypothetical protein
MTIDEEVGRALAAVIDDVRPQPDPYGRVLARYRRSRRRRGVGVVAAVCAVVLGGAVGFATIRPAGTPPAQRHAVDNVNAWAGKLALAPGRGAVAADPAFVADLAARMMQNWRDGWYDGNRLSVGEVRVPYADDVGPYRMALVVLVLTEPDERNLLYASQWVIGPAGTSAAALAAGARSVRNGLDPFDTVRHSGPEGSLVTIGLVPPQCRIATSSPPAQPEWRAEPTGSIIIRTGVQTEPEWWQATCDGVVRMERPSPSRQVLSGPISDAQLDQALLHCRASVDRAAAREYIARSTVVGPEAGFARLPYLIWAGRTRDDVYVAVVAAPAERGGWVGAYVMWRGATPDQFSVAGFRLADDPTLPGATIVAPLSGSEYLAVPPPGAASVLVVASGVTTSTATVVDGAALLSLPALRGQRVEALDPAGSVVGSGGVPSTAPVENGGVDRWGED